MKPLAFTLFSLCAGFFLFAAPSPARADTWAEPETETVLSPGGAFRFTVEPADIGSRLEYFAEELAARSKSEETERPAPIGTLEQRNQDGSWQPIWVRRLVNNVAPVGVLVADDGRSVVTFDNWHSVGRGENVVVIYGPGGTLVRSMPLTALVSDDYKDALPHTTSSLRWKTDAEIDGAAGDLAIDVLVPGTGWTSGEADTIKFRIALSDGAVTKPSDEAWEAAQLAAARVLAAREEAERKRIAFLTDPLTTPEGCDVREWNRYLREAHTRLSSDPPFKAMSWVHLINPPDHPRHEDAVGYFKEDLLEETGYPNDISVVSPCGPGVMASVIKDVMHRVDDNALIYTTLYVSVSRAEFHAIQQSLRPTGAKAVWLDPSAAIPQRPERIPGSEEEAAAREAYYRRQEEEFSEMMDALGAP